ncbi:MAG: hypothetical protein MdMp024_0513 [Bacteroidales bacterium]
MTEKERRIIVKREEIVAIALAIIVIVLQLITCKMEQKEYRYTYHKTFDTCYAIYDGNTKIAELCGPVTTREAEAKNMVRALNARDRWLKFKADLRTELKF